MRSSVWSRFFTFPAMLITALCVSPFIASLDVQQGGPIMRDPDIWWHLRNADLLFSTHRFPSDDLYAFTTHAGTRVNFEWLAEIPYYVGYRLLGERGIFLVMLFAVELIVFGIFLLCYRRCGDVKAAFLAAWIAVLFAAINIGPRTILFGWLCFLVEILLIESYRNGRDRLWLLVPLFAVWINLHGTWLIGLGFFFLFIASGFAQGSWGSMEAVRWTPRQRNKLLTIATLSVAALFLNPYGWQLVAYPFDTIFKQQLGVGFVDEWHSVDFQSFYGKLVFVVFAGLFIFTLARRRSWPLHELLFALVATYAALTHKRFLFLAGIIICPILAVELIGAVFEPYDSKTNRPLLNALFMAGYCVFAFFHIPSTTKLRAAESQYFPVAAIPQLQNSCASVHVFNAYEWGGYLIWNQRNIPVFIDSRADIFEHQGVLADYLKATALDNPFLILDRYQIGCVLLQPNSQLVTLLENSPNWGVQYRDATAALLVRVNR